LGRCLRLLPRLLRSFLLWLLLALVLLLLLLLLLLRLLMLLGLRLRLPLHLPRLLLLPILLLDLLPLLLLLLLLRLGLLGRLLLLPVHLPRRLLLPVLLFQLLLPVALLLLLPGCSSRSLGWGCLAGPRSPALRLGPLARYWPAFLIGLPLGRIGLMIRTGSPPLRRRHLPRVLLPSLGRGTAAHAPLGPLLPPAALAVMVLVIKILVIPLARIVAAPVGIPLREVLDILRVLLIPGVPIRPVPVSRPDDVGNGINVIRSPAVSIPVKIIQHAVEKPIALVIDPRRIGPRPRGRVTILRRGCLVRACIWRT